MKQKSIQSDVAVSVWALDAATGNTKWGFTTGGPIRFAPASGEGCAYVVSDDGYAYCLEAATGKLIWKFYGGLDDSRFACSVSVMPANGLLYMHPFSCKCVGTPIKGYHALDSRELAEKPDPADGRLEKGPAFGTSGKAQPLDQDWPIYRGDAQRTASTSTEIPGDFEALWTADFGKNLTWPTGFRENAACTA